MSFSLQQLCEWVLSASFAPAGILKGYAEKWLLIWGAHSVAWRNPFSSVLFKDDGKLFSWRVSICRLPPRWRSRNNCLHVPNQHTCKHCKWNSPPVGCSEVSMAWSCSSLQQVLLCFKQQFLGRKMYYIYQNAFIQGSWIMSTEETLFAT